MTEEALELGGIIPFKTSISPFQKFIVNKKVLEKFGDAGVNAFEKVDGKASVEKIRSSTEMTPEEILALMESLESEGAVQLKTVYELEKAGTGENSG